MIHHERKILLRIKAILLLGGSIWALGLHAETLGLGYAADEQYVAGQVSITRCLRRLLRRPLRLKQWK